MGRADLIVFAFHLAALMETILITRGVVTPAENPLRWKIHSYFNKPLQRPYKDVGRLYFLC